MNFEEFENEILSELKNDDKQCLKTIENNKKTILTYLKDTEKPIHIKEFVDKLNFIIINKNSSIKKFKLFEEVLNHDLFTKILSEFRSSNVLINACKLNNKDAASWLLTMNVDRYIQDENGMTALMHAARYEELNSIVEELIKDNDDSIHLTDNNGNTALFHGAHNCTILSTLLSSKIDINYQNKDGETLLIYCCKNELAVAVKKILCKVNLDYNRIDNNDRNAAMYLVENGDYQNIRNIGRINKNFDVNYRNKKNECLLSILVSQFRKWYYINDKGRQYKRILPYAVILMELINMGCDFNMPIDEEGNTALMFFMMIGDICSVYYILQKCDLDLSLKNKNGISVTELSTKINDRNNYLKKSFLDHKQFDFFYQDDHKNNILTYYLVKDIPSLYFTCFRGININNHHKVLAQVNDKNENFAIIATKLGYGKHLKTYADLFKYTDINHQDHLGNTALYYAIKIKDKFTVNYLMYNHADINIKNYQGVSAFDLSKEINDENIIEILKNPISPDKFKENENKKNSKFLLFKKKKTKDEKLEDYVQNYQIKNYRTEYEYILNKKEYSYKEIDYCAFFKDNLWLLYSKQGLLDISFGKEDVSTKQSMNNCHIHVRNLVEEKNRGRNNRRRNFIECPF